MAKEIQEEETDYLEEYEKKPQLLNMALEPEEDVDYIIDLNHKDNKIIVTYADGHTYEEDSYSEHNMNFWRRRIIDQIHKHYDAYQEQGGKEAWELAGKELLVVLAPVAAGVVIHLASQFFLQYNIDIHISIKIILESLVILYSLKETLFNFIDFSRLGKLLMESERLKKYADAAHDLEYYNKVTSDYSFVVPVEDMWQHNVSENQLEKIRDYVVKTKRELGGDLQDFELTYKKTDQPKL